MRRVNSKVFLSQTLDMHSNFYVKTVYDFLEFKFQEISVLITIFLYIYFFCNLIWITQMVINGHRKSTANGKL